MAGILGLYLFDSRWNAYNFGVFGLMALQHRGQETAGLELFGSNEGRKKITGKGLVEEVLKPSGGQGHICVGGVSPYPEENAEVLPIALSDKVSVAIDGKILAIDG